MTSWTLPVTRRVEMLSTRLTSFWNNLTSFPVIDWVIANKYIMRV